MRKKLAAVAAATLATLALTGCIRQSAYYYIQSDDTVDGTIYMAVHEDYVSDSDPYRGTGAGEVVAYFANTTVTEFDNPPWIGYHIDFVDEPLATFAAVPDAAWKAQITKAANKYTVYGYTPTAEDESLRDTIHDMDGFLQMTVIFPGALVEQDLADETSVGAEIPGWAGWDMDEVVGTPYAKGNGGLFFHLVPGWADLFDPLDPLAEPPLDPEPAPVVTVVITPEPDAPDTPDTPAASPTPTTAIAAPEGDDEKAAIPAWVWAAGGALVLALAGLIGYTLANRKPKTPEVAAEPKPETPAEKKPTEG